MPCFDGGPSCGESAPELSAILCGILYAIERDAITNLVSILDGVDWKEVGATRKWLENWWAEHKNKTKRGVNKN